MKEKALEYTKLNTGNYGLETVQKNINDSLSGFITKDNIVNRVVVEDIQLTAGRINLVEHRLKRAIRGADIIKSNEAIIYFKWISGYDLTKYLPIVVSSNCIVSLEIW